MAGIVVRGLTHSYGRGKLSVHAVDNVSFEVRESQFYTLLGPSGCGKSTILRCIAGLERAGSGVIELGDCVVSSGRVHVPTHRRKIGMVFQDYAIWPHMTVFGNVAFPLRVRHVPRAEIHKRVMDVLEIVGMADFARQRSTDLSGGQQQRVALARALAPDPLVLLLDEPFSNLDARMRDQMRAELRRLQRRLRVTTLYVTHDQSEALSLSNVIGVMESGRIVQEGAPREVYLNPRSEFVSLFVGGANVLHGTLRARGSKGAVVGMAVLDTDLGQLRCFVSAGVAERESVAVSVRPESAVLHRSEPPGVENAYLGIVRLRLFLGDTMDYDVEVSGRVIRVRTSHDVDLRVGEKVFVEFPAASCVAVPASGSPTWSLPAKT